jgi:tetratricopeptide (TPR) repeat protein
MIERLLAGEAALERGELDAAERLFTQVADADPRNAIAVVGRARVALALGALDDARSLAEHALELDPEEAAARRLLAELDQPTAPASVPQAEPTHEPEWAPLPSVAAPVPAPHRTGWRGWLDRLLRRR